MKLNNIWIIFDVKINNEHKLGYGQFTPYSFNSFGYIKQNLTKKEIIIEYIGLLLDTIDIKSDSVDIISILSEPIDIKHQTHFMIILDQQNNLELKFKCVDPKYILFDDLDYDTDEYEHIYSLAQYKDDLEFKIINEDFLNLYGLEKDIDKAKEELIKYKNIIQDEIKNYIITDDNDKYLMESLKKSVIWLEKRIEEIDLIPNRYEESVIKLKEKKIEQKINFYNYLISNKLVNKKEYLIKISNQIFRRKKLNNLKDIRYNFIVNDFTSEKVNNKHDTYIINFSDVKKEINGIYKLDKKNKHNPNTLEITTLEGDEVVINKQLIMDIFQEDIRYKLFGSSIEDDSDY
jgi:hypothetical protein